MKHQELASHLQPVRGSIGHAGIARSYSAPAQGVVIQFDLIGRDGVVSSASGEWVRIPEEGTAQTAGSSIHFR
ncbi:hypothetical protein VTK26DRAFT_984 [Humicola hyalothermophila]